MWKTDLAIEAKRLWDTSMGEKTELSGVKARSYECCGILADCVEILDEQGASSLGKPIGNYVTLDITPLRSKEKKCWTDTIEAVSETLRAMLPTGKCVLVAGLGNMDITPDTLGPKSLDHILVTKHLQDSGIEPFTAFTSVCAVAPGVLGKTGIESAQIVKGACDLIQADAVVVVDALASCEPERLCGSIQITDTGMVPGSGVGNHRAAFTKESIGVPVIAIGIPTVVDGSTFLRRCGGSADAVHDNLMLSHRDIDQRMAELARLVGFGINLALHPYLTEEDFMSLLS